MRTLLIALRLTVLCLTIVSACSSSKGVHGDLIREGVENPIKLSFRGATVPEAVEVAEKALADLGIRMRISDRNRGYVESIYFDAVVFERVAASTYPARERLVQYQIEVKEDEKRARVVVISAVYRPVLIDRDRLVPTDHPGFTLALRIHDKIRLGLIEANAVLVTDEVS